MFYIMQFNIINVKIYNEIKGIVNVFFFNMLLNLVSFWKKGDSDQLSPSD